MLGLKHPTGRDGGISRPACAAGRSRPALPPPVLPKAKAAGNGRSTLSKAALGTPSRAGKNFYLPDSSNSLIGVPRGRGTPSTSLHPAFPLPPGRLERARTLGVGRHSPGDWTATRKER